MFGFLINPSKFNKSADTILKPLIFFSSVVLIVGLILVYLSPLDYQQGLTVKIMYIHVPSAWLALLTYSIMTIYSIIALAFRMPFGFIINNPLSASPSSFNTLYEAQISFFRNRGPAISYSGGWVGGWVQ